MKRTIELLKIGDLEQSILVKLKNNLENIFSNVSLSITIAQNTIPLENVEYNSERKQYDADKILKRIINYTKNFQVSRILGVLDKDIYSESLTILLHSLHVLV